MRRSALCRQPRINLPGAVFTPIVSRTDGPPLYTPANRAGASIFFFRSSIESAAARRLLHDVVAEASGHFLGIVPAMDAVHYYTMLLVDRARKAGMPADKARQNAAHLGEHALYEFAFGGFRYRGIDFSTSRRSRYIGRGEPGSVKATKWNWHGASSRGRPT